MKTVPFTVVENPPTRLRITGTDGKLYNVTLQLALTQATDMEQDMPPGAVVRAFQFNASVVTTVEKATEEG